MRDIVRSASMEQVRREDTRARLAQVVRDILSRLSDDLDHSQIAWNAGFSRFYFHRLFRDAMGETPGEFVRRLRLERASFQLHATDLSTKEIGVNAGFTAGAFVKAFRAAYGCTPGEFRRRRDRISDQPAPNTVHYRPTGEFNLVLRPLNYTMEITKISKPAMRLGAIRHIGAYHEIGRSFGQIAGWAHRNGIHSDIYIGLYYDDPGSTPMAELRADAAVELIEGQSLPGSMETPDAGALHGFVLPAGDYAVGTYVGPYDGLGDAWGRFMRQCADEGYSMRPSPAIEYYLDDCAKVPVDRLRTELWLPV